MTKRKTVKKAAKRSPAKKRPQPKVPPAVQEALQVTWLLKGKLKNERMAYLKIGALLVQVRDKKMFSDLKHPDIEEYAQKRLKLRRSSLYRYLQVYDWVAKSHKAWLEPHPKGFIPELNDAADLMWIEEELAKKEMKPERRAALEALQKKGLSGELMDADLAKFRRQASTAGASLKSVLSNLRALRRRAAHLPATPPEALADLDAAISLFEKAIAEIGKS